MKSKISFSGKFKPDSGRCKIADTGTVNFNIYVKGKAKYEISGNLNTT